MPQLKKSQLYGILMEFLDFPEALNVITDSQYEERLFCI